MSAGQQPNGGSTSPLKLIVPLVALVVVVFGITFITQYTPRAADEDRKDVGAPIGEPPLRFFTSARRWDPPLLDPMLGYRHHPLLAPSAVSQEGTFSIQDRTFQGVYEQSQTERATQFWFENRNPAEVVMQLKHVSCSSCSGGRVAVIPPDVAGSVLRHSALAALPIGAFNPFGIALTQPLAALARPGALQWTEHKFDAPDKSTVTYRVPGAPADPDRWAPQWNILELRFKANDKPGEVKALDVNFATKIEGSAQQDYYQFRIGFEVARAFAVSPAAINVGRIDALTGERAYDLLVYSATRGPGSEFDDLEKPSSLVTPPPGTTDPVKFVEVTKVERVPEDGLVAVAEQLAASTKLARVRSAYRVTVAVRPVVGETRLDIGKFERTISFAAGGETVQLPVKAVVSGPVRLDSGSTEFELASFPGGKGTVQMIDLTTDSAAIELAVREAECESDGLKFELEKQTPRGDRGAYKLKVGIPPGKIFGATKGVVVLEVKGNTPQRMRIPFKGTGTN